MEGELDSDITEVEKVALQEQDAEAVLGAVLCLDSKLGRMSSNPSLISHINVKKRLILLR